MCSYRRGSFVCNGEGVLWDTASGGMDYGADATPCPHCEMTAFLMAEKVRAETTLLFSRRDLQGTGADIWREAVDLALECDAPRAHAILQSIGVVEALARDECHPSGYRTETFDYRAATISCSAGGLVVSSRQ